MLTYYFEVKKQFPTTYKSIKETHSEYNWVTNQICTFSSKEKWNWPIEEVLGLESKVEKKKREIVLQRGSL